MLLKVPKAYTPEYIETADLSTIWYCKSDGGKPGLRTTMKNGKITDLWFLTDEDRQEGMHAIEMATSVKGKSMFTSLVDDLRVFLKENRDLIFTVLFVLLIDHFLFEDALRERVKKLVEGFLTKVENKATIIDVTRNG